ncbi:MAG: DUF3098 domain-containing protein [Bacteroidetes bacterium]|nr:DUF3098 domain-containing protein [Bacteroidota bacterium]
MEKKEEAFEFGKKNYLLIIAGVVVMAIGFIMLSGGGTEDPNQFNPDELFSARRITGGPITVLIGLGIVLFGVLKKPE